jgi:hypothetical protein
LLEVLRRPVVRHGQWQLVDCTPAWEGNGSSDNFIAYAWDDADGGRLLIAVNYSDHPSPMLRPAGPSVIWPVAAGN